MAHIIWVNKEIRIRILPARVDTKIIDNLYIFLFNSKNIFKMKTT